MYSAAPPDPRVYYANTKGDEAHGRIGRQEIDIAKVWKWMLVASSSALTALVIVLIPEGVRHSTAGEGTGSRPRCYRQRGRRTGRVHAQEKISRRKPGNANAGRPGRHEKAHAELTGAG